MKEYRICTHFTDNPKEPYPWSAFVFLPEYKGQTPMEYLATNMRIVDDLGNIAVGVAESEAVFNLFKSQGPKPYDPDKKKRNVIFEQNRKF